MLLSPKFSLSTIHVRLTAKGVAAEPANFFRVSEKHCHFPHRFVWHTSLCTVTLGGGGHHGYLAGAVQKFLRGQIIEERKLMGEPGIICQNKQLSLVLQHMCLALFLICKLLSRLGLFVESRTVALDAPSSLL